MHACTRTRTHTHTTTVDMSAISFRKLWNREVLPSLTLQTPKGTQQFPAAKGSPPHARNQTIRLSHVESGVAPHSSAQSP